MCKYLLQDTCHRSHLSPVQAAPVHGHGGPDEPAAPPADRQNALSSPLFRYHWKMIQTMVTYLHEFSTLQGPLNLPDVQRGSLILGGFSFLYFKLFLLLNVFT